MKVFVVEKIDEYDGQVNTDFKVFDTLKKAQTQKMVWLEEEQNFIDDIESFIKDGNKDCILESEKNYFYAYDSYNFDALTITINEIEVE